LRARPSTGFARPIETMARPDGDDRLPGSDPRWVAMVALVALAVTAVVLLVPSVTFAYPLPFAAAFVASLASVTALVVGCCSTNAIAVPRARSTS
jgi:hypothetical protein